MFKEENLKEMILDHQENSEKTVNEKRAYRITTSMELIKKVNNEPEPTFLWNGIPEGSIGLITGVAKTGKTTFAENLATSLAVGRKEFFGYSMDGKPRKVLFINLEESYKIRSRRNAKQIQSLNDEELELYKNNYISTPEDFPEYLNEVEDWQILTDYIKKSEAEVVFIDSLSHMCIGEIEKSAVAQEFTKKVKIFLGRLNKTIIVVHHNTKGNEKPMTMDNIAGSRFINQEFQFAFGFGNIPTREGGNYACMLYNKYIEKDDSTAYLYRVDKTGWIDFIKKSNKHDLYQSFKRDGRSTTNNPKIIYDYVSSKSSQGSTTITAKEFMSDLVATGTMSRDTFYRHIDTIVSDGILKKEESVRGIYKIVKKGGVDAKV